MCFVFSPQASELEGEIDLTKCFNVSEFQVQRNYGFQIHVRKKFTDKTSNFCLIETIGKVFLFYVLDPKRCLHIVSHDFGDS